MPGLTSTDIEGGLVITAEVSPRKIAEVQAMLKLLDPKLRRALSRDLNKSLKPIAKQIEADFPAAPMSGLASRWGNVTAAVRVDINGPPQRALARFIVKANPPSFARLLSITERAGSRSPGLTPQGRSLISNPSGGLQQRHPLVGSGGRFVFASAHRQRNRTNRAAMDSINRFIDKFNKGG